jgi:hypothetical protein
MFGLFVRKDFIFKGVGKREGQIEIADGFKVKP